MQRTIALLLPVITAALAGCALPPTSPVNSATLATPSRAAAADATSEEASPVASGLALTTPSVGLNPVQLVAPDAPRTVDLTAHADDVWDRIRMGFAVPNMESPLVVEQQAWFLSHADFLQRAVERSSHYLYHVVEELEKRHMPTELALLPFVESAYNPMAYSRAHASGMWQFVPATGKNYNLRQDWWRDERRDVVASTDAALNYLESLYEMHGDWTLALASYNWGEGSVKRAIERNQALGKPTDYMSLNMPDETRNYYPKLQALKNIIANPEAFGVTLPRISNEPYFVAVPRTRDMDIATAARLADMSLDEFRALNPSFNRPLIAAAPDATLLLPADRAATFQSNVEGSVESLTSWQAYTVSKGDRVERIAARFGMSTASLCEANGVAPKTRLRPGQALLVQRHDRRPAAPTEHIFELNPSLPPEPVVVRAALTTRPAASRVVRYSVRAGDTLYGIALRSGTSVAALQEANRLHGAALHVGQVLAIPASAAASSASPVATR